MTDGALPELPGPATPCPPAALLVRVKTYFPGRYHFAGCPAAVNFLKRFGALGGLFMRIRNVAMFSAAVLAGALAGSLVGPRPAEAVARELIELQRDVTSCCRARRISPLRSP